MILLKTAKAFGGNGCPAVSLRTGDLDIGGVILIICLLTWNNKMFIEENVYLLEILIISAKF